MSDVHRSKAPWLFAAGAVLFLAASLLDFAGPFLTQEGLARHHYLRATIDLALGLYCGVTALRIRAKEKRMANAHRSG